MTPEDHPIQAAAAAVDITPAPGCYLAGYGLNRLAESALDPLWARAVAIQVGRVKCAVLAIDCIGVTPPLVAAIEQLVKLAPGRLLICATHTHTGPDTIGLWGPDAVTSGVSEAVMQQLVEGGATAVNAALERLQPAVMTFSRTLAPMRCAVNVRDAESLDKTIAVMHLASADAGLPIATLLNWACHPETLPRTITALSSDFADALRQRLEARLGGTALFVNGALGAMVTVAAAEETVAEAARIGQTIADVAVTALRATEELLTHTRLAIATRDVTLPLVSPRLLAAVDSRILGSLPEETGQVTVPVTAWSLGPSTWLAVPGEVTPALGQRWKRMMRRRHRMLLGLANGEIGYILDESAFSDPRYSYECSMSLGPETAELLNEAVGRVLAAVDG